MSGLLPSIKTAITGEGAVVFRDQTRYGLHRMCVAEFGKYPDLETWTMMLPKSANVEQSFCRYAEKILDNVFIGYLWIYWKEKP